MTAHGYLISIYGVTLHQTYLYFRTLAAAKDTIQLKLFVSVLPRDSSYSAFIETCARSLRLCRFLIQTRLILLNGHSQLDRHGLRHSLHAHFVRHRCRIRTLALQSFELTEVLVAISRSFCPIWIPARLSTLGCRPRYTLN